ncbi:MAG: TatD family hydrolase [Candidatus Tectimicrobiota bacterium]
MHLVDVHCHLDAPAYADLEAFCQQSQAADVCVTVAAGKGLLSNQQILALHRRQPAQIWAALGLHPERLDSTWEELAAVLAQAEEHRADIVALGEIGLPHYALLDQRMSQEQAREREAMLHALVQAAVRLALPVVLHAPHAASALALDIVQRYQPPGALFHWHKGTPETTAALCEAGYFLSVTPEVCYRERDRQLVQSVPVDHLLLESDGPWPYDGEFRGRPTTSALVARLAEEVAQLKHMETAEVRAITTANAYRLFGQALPGGDRVG